MNKSNSRRIFINKLGLATTGLFTLSSVNPLHAFGNYKSPYPGYNPFVEAGLDMRISPDPKDHLEIFGKIFCRRTKNVLSDISIEVWHLSSTLKKYRHHAKLASNANGEYQFYTDIPGREAGKFPRIFYRITGNNNSYFTELIVGTNQAFITGEHWLRNQQLNELIQPIKEDSKICFNLSI